MVSPTVAGMPSTIMLAGGVTTSCQGIGRGRGGVGGATDRARRNGLYGGQPHAAKQWQKTESVAQHLEVLLITGACDSAVGWTPLTNTQQVGGHRDIVRGQVLQVGLRRRLRREEKKRGAGGVRRSLETKASSVPTLYVRV